MIDFHCEHCGKAFSIDDRHAGKRAACKGCGQKLTVPQPTPVVAAPAKVPMRTRRLRADAEAIAAAFAGQDVIEVSPLAGEPPEAYRVTYRIHSLDRGPGGKPVPRDVHEAEIQLTSEYPRVSPKCKLLTPIFHPNIDPATICIGDHWTAGERLADLIVRIGEMLAYQAYNIQSPLDAEAAMWADLHGNDFPTDPRNLRPVAMDAAVE